MMCQTVAKIPVMVIKILETVVLNLKLREIFALFCAIFPQSAVTNARL